MNVLSELKNRGVKDVLIICSDNLPVCIVHQVRNSLKYVSYKDLKEVAKDLKEIYQAPTEEMALAALDRFEVIYTTNPIESLNSQIRKLNKSRVIFPNEEALFKGVYLAVVEVTRKWTSKIRDWPLILSQLAVYCEDRLGGYL